MLYTDIYYQNVEMWEAYDMEYYIPIIYLVTGLGKTIIWYFERLGQLQGIRKDRANFQKFTWMFRVM